jgi:CheY-like chemotaxis protein
MTDLFDIASARVIGVDPSGAVRQLLTDVFRTQGFEKVQAMPSLKDVLGTMEVDKVDLIITPLMLDQTPNGLQLLKIISEIPELRTTKVVFLVEAAEMQYLSLSFSLGLMAWIPKPYNKDTLTQEVTKFRELFSSTGWDATKVAADYCLANFEKEKMFQSQIDLSMGLLNLYPGEANYLLRMAKPLFHLNQVSEAKNALHQAKLLANDLDSKIDEIAKELFGEEGIGSSGDSATDILKLGGCAIVDPDSNSASEIKDILNKIGVTEIVEFQDGNSAWIWLQENPLPGFIFMEWRIPELTGPYLIQRLRKKFPSTPIVVVSSLIEGEDEQLIREMGVSELIQKPIDKAAFLRKLVTAIRQERLPTNVEILERKIRQYLNEKNLELAGSLRTQYLAEPSISPLRKMKIEAEFAYSEGNYTKARNLAAESLRGSPDSVIILNLLGKTLMQLHDHTAALRCFKKAQDISPKNIQRLCAIAEASAEMKKTGDSDAAIDSAKEQDQGNGEIVQAEVKIAISAGDVNKASELMAGFESISELISYMNNKAVSLARCGKIDEGIEIYRRTIDSVPAKSVEIRAVVIYNLALAFVRMGEQGEAAEALQKAINLGATRILKKSKSLKQRLTKAMETGQVITLDGDANHTSDPKKTSSEEIGSSKSAESEKGNNAGSISAANRAVSALAAIKPGDLCCFRLFTDPLKMSPQVSAWFEKLPRFKVRVAIAREESRGADKLLSSGS